jgi:hypothetical protein
MAIMLKGKIRIVKKGNIIEKALTHKYIKRWPKPTGKGWNYLYPSDFLKPFIALKTLFGFKQERIDKEYEDNNIQKDYEADKKTFGAHVLEYLSNKVKWDTFFANKDNRGKNKKPQKTGGGGKRPGGTGTDGKTGGPNSPKDGKGGIDKKAKGGYTINRSLMRKVWSIFNREEERTDGRANGKDNPGTGRGSIPADTETVQPGEDQGHGGQHGVQTVQGTTGDQSNALQLPGEPGERPGRNVRLTKKETINIREACLALLNSKTDDQMTEADKDLLRQYEGAGGLGDDEASTHGTLYEFYTPMAVTKKVWQIVDKYIPGSKSVLEPSAGIGRFAEDRLNDKFTLNEFDGTSSRISGILHPEADNKNGAFQEMFSPGKPYTGKKFDVVIGNPPYGKYEGLWKGKGEGADHTRYEEYFIDRGLDTLREGGVMAFVVPSAFLRGGDSKIKQKIAGKGKLMEAWRLPNGTFSTTGVGTDIIVIRKEKGDPAQLSGNAYFENNPGMVMGEETTRMGRFGEEKYVALEAGETFDEAIDRIKAEEVEASPIGEPTAIEEVKQNSEVKATKQKKSRSKAMIGNQNAAGKHDVDTAEEFNAKYNKHIAPEALPVWKVTQWDSSIDFSALDEKSRKYVETSGNYVKAADGKWYDIVNFASGDIYEKLTHLERDKELLAKKEYERQKSILESVLPAKKAVTEFELSPLSDIAEQFITTEEGRLPPQERKRGEDRHTHFQRLIENNKVRALSLLDAFKGWISKTNHDDLGLGPKETKFDILAFVNKEPVRAAAGHTDKAKEDNKREAEETKKVRRIAAERLFTQFIREQLSLEDQGRLADKYNRQYNSTVQADYTRIPVFLDGISKTFKGHEFKANESQIKTNSWLANQGNGIVALDVGVGKTLTAIMSAVNDMQMGRCKKPIVAVPKAVYKNWIAEIKEIFPGIKINELGNFSEIGGIKNEDGTLNIEDGSISICTYEALREKITFKDETLQGELKDSFVEALSTGKEGDRDQAQEEESIMTMVGKSSRAGDNWVYWEDTGFDHITVDEAHNFRNSFSKPRSKNKGDADEFKDIPGGSTSLQGLKLFAITQLIQKQNNGRNVHLLTATPFQNSPVEIYNMLAYVAREQLKKAGISNFHEFLAQFSELKSELVPDSKGNIVNKNVMKGFKNLPALQRLLNQYIMKIDGEDAGIIRPDMKPHHVDLNPTAEQRDITEKIRAYMESNPDPKEDPGATLRCLNALRQAALSPALVDGFQFLDPVARGMAGIRESAINVENRDFVKSSPKLTFIGDTAAEIYKKHPDKGQIIHLPQGVSRYDDVMDYLVSRGIPKDAIAFMAPVPKGKKAPPYLKAGDAGLDQKDEITKEFNDPNGRIKVIIGSDTIIEGVNLNGNTIQTYEAMLPWNSTDFQQLIGRSHRQGNSQGNVHITVPLMTDSVDSFMYQKHDEKGSRLDTLWKSDKDKIDIDGIDPEALKFSLIKDPRKRADLYIKEKTAEFEMKKQLAQTAGDKIFAWSGEYRDYITENSGYQEEIERYRKAQAEFSAISDEEIIKEYDLDFSDKYGSGKPSVDGFNDGVAGYVSGAGMKEIRKNYAVEIKEMTANAKKTMDRNKGKMATIANSMSRYGIENPANMAEAERVQKRYSEEALTCEKQIAEIEKNRDTYIKQAAEDIKKSAKAGVSVSEAMARNSADVMNNLYSFDVVKEREEARKNGGTVKKSFALLLRKKIRVQWR